MFRVLCLAAIFLPQLAMAERQTAFRAYTALPAEAAWRLVRIAACEGAPAPERWHFVVHDPQQENGLRDYVVENGQVVARNGVSQFASEARPEDVLTPGSVRIDSDRIAALAEAYAEVNGMAVAALNYELRKDLLEGQPIWKVTCMDAQNRTLGWLICDAKTAEVLAHGGFFYTPNQRPEAVGEPLFDPTESEGGFRPPPETKSPPRPRRKIEVRRAEPAERPKRIEIDPLRAVRDLLRL